MEEVKSIRVEASAGTRMRIQFWRQISGISRVAYKKEEVEVGWYEIFPVGSPHPTLDFPMPVARVWVDGSGTYSLKPGTTVKVLRS